MSAVKERDSGICGGDETIMKTTTDTTAIQLPAFGYPSFGQQDADNNELWNLDQLGMSSTEPESSLDWDSFFDVPVIGNQNQSQHQHQNLIPPNVQDSALPDANNSILHTQTVTQSIGASSPSGVVATATATVKASLVTSNSTLGNRSVDVKSSGRSEQRLRTVQERRGDEGRSSEAASLSYEELYNLWEQQRKDLKSKEQTVRNMQGMLLEEQELREKVRKRRDEACKEVERCKRDLSTVTLAREDLVRRNESLVKEMSSDKLLIQQLEAKLEDLKYTNQDLQTQVRKGEDKEKIKLKEDLKEQKRLVRKYEREIDEKVMVIQQLRIKIATMKGSNKRRSDSVQGDSGDDLWKMMSQLRAEVLSMRKEFLGGGSLIPSQRFDPSEDTDNDTLNSRSCPSSTYSNNIEDGFDALTVSSGSSVTSTSPNHSTNDILRNILFSKDYSSRASIFSPARSVGLSQTNQNRIKVPTSSSDTNSDPSEVFRTSPKKVVPVGKERLRKVSYAKSSRSSTSKNQKNPVEAKPSSPIKNHPTLPTLDELVSDFQYPPNIDASSKPTFKPSSQRKPKSDDSAILKSCPIIDFGGEAEEVVPDKPRVVQSLFSPPSSPVRGSSPLKSTFIENVEQVSDPLPPVVAPEKVEAAAKTLGLNKPAELLSIRRVSNSGSISSQLSFLPAKTNVKKKEEPTGKVQDIPKVCSEAKVVEQNISSSSLSDSDFSSDSDSSDSEEEEAKEIQRAIMDLPLLSPEKRTMAPVKTVPPPEKKIASPEKKIASPEKKIMSPDQKIPSPEKKIVSSEKKTVCAEIIVNPSKPGEELPPLPTPAPAKTLEIPMEVVQNDLNLSSDESTDASYDSSSSDEDEEVPPPRLKPKQAGQLPPTKSSSLPRLGTRPETNGQPGSLPALPDLPDLDNLEKSSEVPKTNLTPATAPAPPNQLPSSEVPEVPEVPKTILTPEKIPVNLTSLPSLEAPEIPKTPKTTISTPEETSENTNSLPSKKLEVVGRKTPSPEKEVRQFSPLENKQLPELTRKFCIPGNIQEKEDLVTRIVSGTVSEEPVEPVDKLEREEPALTSQFLYPQKTPEPEVPKIRVLQTDPPKSIKSVEIEPEGPQQLQIPPALVTVPKKLPEVPPKKLPEVPPKKLPEVPPKKLPEVPPKKLPEVPPKKLPEVPPKIANPQGITPVPKPLDKTNENDVTLSTKKLMPALLPVKNSSPIPTPVPPVPAVPAIPPIPKLPPGPANLRFLAYSRRKVSYSNTTEIPCRTPTTPSMKLQSQSQPHPSETLIKNNAKVSIKRDASQLETSPSEIEVHQNAPKKSRVSHCAEVKKPVAIPSASAPLRTNAPKQKQKEQDPDQLAKIAEIAQRIASSTNKKQPQPVPFNRPDKKLKDIQPPAPAVSKPEAIQTPTVSKPEAIQTPTVPKELERRRISSFVDLPKPKLSLSGGTSVVQKAKNSNNNIYSQASSTNARTPGTNARDRIRSTMGIIAIGSGENICDKKRLEMFAQKNSERRKAEKEKELAGEKTIPPSTQAVSRRSNVYPSREKSLEADNVSLSDALEQSTVIGRKRQRSPVKVPFTMSTRRTPTRGIENNSSEQIICNQSTTQKLEKSWLDNPELGSNTLGRKVPANSSRATLMKRLGIKCTGGKVVQRKPEASLGIVPLKKPLLNQKPAREYPKVSQVSPDSEKQADSMLEYLFGEEEEEEEEEEPLKRQSPEKESKEPEKIQDKRRLSQTKATPIKINLATTKLPAEAEPTKPREEPKARVSKVESIQLLQQDEDHHRTINTQVPSGNAEGLDKEKQQPQVKSPLLRLMLTSYSRKLTVEEIRVQVETVFSQNSDPGISCLEYSRRMFLDLQDYLQTYYFSKKKDEMDVINESRKACEKIRILQSVFPLIFRELHSSAVVYFIEEVLSNVAQFPFKKNEYLDQLGVCYGTICREFNLTVLGLRMFQVVLTHRVKQKHVFAHGFVLAFPDLWTIPFECGSIVEKSVVLSLLYGPSYINSIYFKNLRIMMQEGCELALPDCTFRQVFGLMWEEFKELEFQSSIEEGEGALVMLLLQTDWSQAGMIIQENLDAIYKDWSECRITDKIFGAFFDVVVKACELTTHPEPNFPGKLALFEKIGTSLETTYSSRDVAPPLKKSISCGLRKLTQLIERGPRSDPELVLYTIEEEQKHKRAVLKFEKTSKRRFKRFKQHEAKREKKSEDNPD